MDEQDIQQEILNVKAQFESSEAHSSSLTNPLSRFRYRLVAELQCNGFDRYSIESSNIHPECEEILKYSLDNHDYEMFEQVLWLIKDVKNQYTRKALIMKYISLCSRITDERIETAVDQLLEYLHEDIDATWHYHIGFLFDLLHFTGANIENLISLIETVKISNVLNDVQLKSKLTYDDQTISTATVDQTINCIKRVFRIILSLGYFQVEKLNSTLSSDNYLFLFLLAFYLQLDKRFQDLNTIHLARRLMVNSLTLLPSTDWNEKRDAIVECLYTFSGKNTYIIELFLKTNERTVRIRTQLALLHLKRLVNMIEHVKKSEAMIIEEIIKTKLDPRLFERQSDFLDCVRLLADIIDSYPYDQQIEYLSKLHEKIEPFTKKDHEKLLTDEQILVLFDNCQRWGTMLKPHVDKSKRLKTNDIKKSLNID